MDQITNRAIIPPIDLKDGGLTVEGVSKSYEAKGDTTEVLRDISFNVGEGEILGIVGRSGCGKSTLLKLIAGLDRDFDGRITLDGREVIGPGLERGVVFQEPRLFPWLTVEQNVAISIHETRMPSGEKQELVASNLALVGLAGFETKFPHQISGGMAQRAALARALTSRPSLLLLDEPFAALDALTKMQLQDEVIRIWQSRKMSIVLITHDIDEAIHLCDRVIVMSPRPGEIKSVTSVEIARPRPRVGIAADAIRSRLMSDLGLF
ncbi:ABC transporter ATP-binding protein [Agrobacterium sp. Ap1]|jgi:sulfonate transport system ATP-binding protein|uniref:ABC transporter ATP-binding protein n=1 Tax=Rhizobium/Agrobacterium group TaxID=227290 RepID=UPI001A909EFB|nr:ABC transporter ATP-binding protein [Agrobacterium sp. Ap1]MBO0144714.1 ABC transporter ATP-binding protein [Agrobacterium sp. Ap1]